MRLPMSLLQVETVLTWRSNHSKFIFIAQACRLDVLQVVPCDRFILGQSESNIVC
jgi:hypothetical protein